VRCRVPAQLVLEAGAGLEAARARLGAAGIQLPLLAKSLWADGGAASHSMAAVANYAGLRQLVEGEAPPGLAPPVLVQQYVDHGTCLFKVYVLGEDAVCVTRPSLRLGADAAQQATQSSTDLNSSGATRIGDSPPEEPASAAAAPAAAAAPGLQLVPRVSAYPRSRPWGREDLAPPGHGVAPPPEWAWRQLARRLRHTLGLELFNFDLIVPAAGVAGGGGSAQGAAGEVMDVYLIDINYFPGYEKLAGYEELMVRFLRGLRPGGSGG
jgi:inositol-1,3,4-trisphosphate 5/6-kinase/inositol-tetrakisphosphate 1-kinase